MLADAAEQTRLTDFGDDWFLGPLGAWAQDLEQPSLNKFGRRFMRSRAVRDLARRLRILDTLRRHPEISDVPIPPIVYVTGLERSGTTLLHNLLALHRDARVLRRWELMEPLPPPTSASYLADSRIASVQSQVDRLKGTTLERMHWVNANDPDECVLGFMDSVSMLGQVASLCMPKWRRFLVEEDLRPAFSNYRRVVQLLLWKHPVPPGGFLVLKAPQISGHLAQFAQTFPEARFVITDRDPYRCVVSMAVMGESIVEPFCQENPVTGDGQRSRLCMRNIPARLDHITAFTAEAPSRTLHLSYPELVHHPIDTVLEVYASHPAPDADLPAKVEIFLERQRAGERAAPPSALASMGYQRSEVWGDPSVSAYCKAFGIRAEQIRLTGYPSARTYVGSNDPKPHSEDFGEELGDAGYNGALPTRQLV